MSAHADPPLPDDDKLRECESILQYQFRDRDLLRRSLTHSSVSTTRLDSNERLEFLGDAVLGLVVCELLFTRYPDYPEGELTRIKSSLVSRATCAKTSRRLGLSDCLFLGKGLTAGGVKVPTSVIAASFESVIAAVYLDGGLAAARALIERCLEEEIIRLAEQAVEENYKSQLQQTVQRDFQLTPAYDLLDEKGPDHSKCFKIAAVVGEQTFPAAWGSTKKQAEQRAAQNALASLEGNEIPYAAD